MRCANCNTDNPDDGKFCVECGTALTRTCPRCGTPNSTTAKFCSECGERLSPADASAASPTLTAAAEPQSVAADGDRDGAAQPDKHPPRFAAALAAPMSVTVPPTVSISAGERKLVTALFADIKGSTELMEDIDPEEAQALIDPALRLMIEAVQHFDGYIVQSTGDGVFALFGAPVAHEDHPQRALYAALRMQDELRKYGARLRAEGRAPIEIRVGVNTGDVVVRSIQTGARTAEYTPIGHTTNLAARLQTIASTGSIVVSKDTERIVAGYFTLKPLGPVKMRGISEAVEVFEVAGIGPLRTRLQASAIRGLSKFVGRTRETAKLMDAFGLATGGHGQIVAAVADAGVGKSRLFYEFKAIAGANALTLEAYSVSHGKASAYLPVIDLLNDYFAIAPEDDRRRRREKVGGKILMLDRALEDTLPFLIALLGLQDRETDAAGSGDGAPTGMDAQTRSRLTLKAIGRILLRESRNQPLIVIFEDLHWVDNATQGLLDLIAENVAAARVLMLVNYRPEYRHRWAAMPNYTELRLEPLGLAGADLMLDALLESATGEATLAATNGAAHASGAAIAELKRFIIEKTEGNPLFIEEMVRTLFERGALRRDGALELVTPLDEIRVPPTVNGILAARIDRLSADEKELLQTLAVIGKEFTLSLVKRVASPAMHERLEEMLSDLQADGFVYEEPAAGESNYSFKHALIQDVAYNSVLVERRKLLHERTAAAIETLYAERRDDYVAELAHHYGRSGNAARAVEYLERAAIQSARRAAYAEAVYRLTEALALLRTLPVTPETARHEFTIQSALGQYLIPFKGVAADEVKVAFERASELARDYGTKDELFWLVYGLQFHYLVRLELATAREIGERQVAIAERSGDAAMRMAAYVGLGQTLLLMGEPEAARDLCDRAMSLPQHLPNFPLADIGDARAMILSISASVLAITGYPDQALRRSDEAVAIARLTGPHSLIVAINSAAELRFRLADWDAVLEKTAELEELAAERDFGLWAAYARELRGQAFIHIGRVEEGIELMKQGAADFEFTGTIARQWRIHYADALGRLGRADEALAMLTDIENGLSQAGWALSMAEIHRLRGELLLTRNGPDDAMAAEASFREAIDVAVRQHARLFELRATTSRASLLDSQGRRDEARAMLADVYGQFTEGFGALDLQEARALLDRLGDPIAQATPS
jgi:class 3 adenylate cyclase/tetratricopeptide (TPR) repeat protein